jgi:hypothetical protein
MHLTGTDLTVIGLAYAAAIGLVMWLARNPRCLQTPAPRLHPLGMLVLVVVMISLIGAVAAAAFDPAAPALLSRLIT